MVSASPGVQATSSLSSAEVSRLWEEPRDSRKTRGDSVGIPADVNNDAPTWGVICYCATNLCSPLVNKIQKSNKKHCRRSRPSFVLQQYWCGLKVQDGHHQ